MPDEELVASTQFSAIESHAYSETVEQQFQFKVLNIFSRRILNGLAMEWSSYVPHSHADICAILGHWTRLLPFFVAGAGMPFLGWPADFASAYRQMPLAVLKIIFSGFVHYDYGLRA